MVNFIKKYKIVLIVFIFILFLIINTKVYGATYTFTSEEYYDSMPEAVSNSIRSLSYWNDNSYAGFGFHNGAYPYRVVFVKNTSSTVTLDAGHIYFPSVKPYYIFTYNADGTLRSSETYNGNYGYEGIESTKRFIFKNVKVVDNSTNIDSNNIVTPGYKFSIELSTTENTSNPIYAYSNYFSLDDLGNYEVYISTDSVNYNLMNIETMNYLDGTCEFRYNYKIINNGVYYFKFVDKVKNENTFITYEVTNILQNSSNTGFNSDGIPQPFVNYERLVDEFIFKTQTFTFEDFKKLECYYTTDPNQDYSSWNKMSLGTYNNPMTSITEYYFFFTTPKESEDTTYYFVFYDTTLQKYGYKSSLNCIFDEMNKYSDTVGVVVEEKQSKFDELLNYFKDRFGFLTYPFEFIIDLLNRILNINYEEPIIHFPQITNPINDEVIFNGFDYNFKSILEYEGILYFYNIYLIAVDFIFIVAFVKGCKHTLEGVFGNG